MKPVVDRSVTRKQKVEERSKIFQRAMYREVFYFSRTKSILESSDNEFQQSVFKNVVILKNDPSKRSGLF
jgi:hypothetical protein